MFDEFGQPDCYSAPDFDPAPAFDPFELTFDAPTFEPEIYQHPEDPMAYVLPSVVDAYAFDPLAPNAAVGYAMNEIARSLKLSEQTMAELHDCVEYAAEICSKYRLPVVMSCGFPWVSDSDIARLIPDAHDRDEYQYTQGEYQSLTGFRF